jgi:hypothetical protein
VNHIDKIKQFMQEYASGTPDLYFWIAENNQLVSEPIKLEYFSENEKILKLNILSEHFKKNKVKEYYVFCEVVYNQKKTKEFYDAITVGHRKNKIKIGLLIPFYKTESGKYIFNTEIKLDDLDGRLMELI